ncbi:MAG: DUF4124 domain-containing protein [Candidatus Competibacteraceae bacterium]|nr:MAG: DUF4124 domain-containing protein [Candidatus Competibacteraceae bacterium]
MKRRLLAGLIPAALALSGPVQADIYAFVDSNGVRHLSNIPNDPRYKLVMRTPAYSQQAARPSSYAPSNLYNANRSATLTPRSYNAYNGSTSKRRPLRVNEQNRQRFSADVDRIATQYRLEPALMHAVISAESSYNPWAVSPKGAMGLMQLMPGTAERFGVNNPYDPIANMHGGARYLRWLLDQFNDPRLAVAAYNAGEGAVQKYGNQVPPYQETQTYVVRVLDFYQQYRQNGASPPSVAYNDGVGGGGGNNYNYQRTSTGVTIIVPRTGNRAGGLNTASTSTSTGNMPRTYLTPNNGRVTVGASGTENRGAGRIVVKTNPNTRVTTVSNVPLFAGNDK